jgi:NADH dehydrogenase
LPRHPGHIPEKDDQAAHQLPRGVRRRGRIAWLAWVALHIVTLVGHRNRLATLANPLGALPGLAGPGRLNVIVGDPP